MTIKNMLLSTVKRDMDDLVRIYFGLLKSQVKFQINLFKARDFNTTQFVWFFYTFSLHYFTS